MGKIIELNFKDIIPSQNFILERYLKEFLYSYLEKADKNIIVPVVSWKPLPSKKVLIDGHHRASVLYLLNKMDKRFDIYGWLTNNKNDLINELPADFYQEGDTITDMNRNIIKRFNDVLDCPYSNLEELVNKYGYTQSIEKLISKCYNVAN